MKQTEVDLTAFIFFLFFTDAFLKIKLDIISNNKEKKDMFRENAR
jgi:hypothetical protein